ncbi:unnamed protein product [Auanema sp. JU1783]|nr:unnamed protein product [Auanema sp. JU1783]
MQYIVSVDIGTTTIRACLYGKSCNKLKVAEEKVDIEISGQDEWELRVEIAPEKLLEQFIRVVQSVLKDVSAEDSVAMALCCQRNSFVFWKKSTGKPLHKIVCWNDARARKSCEDWNGSVFIKMLNAGGSFLHFFTRMPRFMAAKNLKFLSAMVTHRALVTLETIPGHKALINDNDLGFGCLETWLINRISVSDNYLADASNISSTGLYDPYINGYNNVIIKILGFPTSILAPICDSISSKELCFIKESFFGRKIPISAILADQQSALYGSGGWDLHDVKISLGTGTFVDMNTGNKPHASMNGLYPLVGWRMNNTPVYIAEGNDHDTAVLLKWAGEIGLFENVQDTSDMAFAVKSTNGLLFVPAFGGLQTPINDGLACCSFMGLRPDTKKVHMVRAILESIVYRVYQIYQTMMDEVKPTKTSKIRICGGVAHNDFVCQSISDMLNCEIERVTDGGLVACRGVALLAGVQLGLWKEADLPNMISIESVFKPNADSRRVLVKTFPLWLQAVKRSTKFY